MDVVARGPSPESPRYGSSRARRPWRRARFLSSALLATIVALGFLVAALPVVAQNPTPPAGGSMTWGIQPSTAQGPDGRGAFDWDLSPGSILDDYVGVSNLGSEPLSLVLYATDAYTTDDGGFALLPKDQPPTGVGAWIETAARDLVIQPNTRLDIPIRITVPRDAEPGDHAGGIVASLVAAGADGQGNAVEVERRVGTRIYLNVAGEERPALEIHDVSASYDAGWNPISGTLTVRFSVTNTGNIRLAAAQTVSASGPFGLWRKSLDALSDLPEILPGGPIATTTTITDVPPLFDLAGEVHLGPYPTREGVVVAVDPVSAAAHTWALPILLTGLVLLAVEAVVLALRWRRRRALATQQRLDDAVAAAVERGIEIGRASTGEAAPTEPVGLDTAMPPDPLASPDGEPPPTEGRTDA
jgi:hypothetical protein